MKPDEDNKVLILGATGNFVRKIAKGLVEKTLSLLLAVDNKSLY